MFIRIPDDRIGIAAPESEITVIDVARAVVVDRMPLHGIAGVFHVAFSADGRLGVVAEYHPKNLVPLAHLEHGGAFAYTLTVFGADVGKAGWRFRWTSWSATHRGRSAWRLRRTRSRIYVTCGGSEMVTVIDVPRLLRFIHAHPAAVCAGSFRQRQLCGGADSRWDIESARADADAAMAAGCLWPTGWTTRSA